MTNVFFFIIILPDESSRLLEESVIILSEASRGKCSKLIECLHKKVKKCTFKLAQNIYKKNVLFSNHVSCTCLNAWHNNQIVYVHMRWSAGNPINCFGNIIRMQGL